MILLYSSHNLFELNVIRQALSDAGIDSVLKDEHSGALMQGIGNIYARIMVLEEDLEDARAVLKDHT